MFLSTPPPGYSQADQQQLRGELDRADRENWKRGRDIQLAQRERLILRSPAGSRFAVQVGDIGVLSAMALSGTDLAPRSLLFTPGGDGTVSFYRVDSTHAQNPRTDTIASISGDVITLTNNVADTFFEQTYMAGVSYARIWNTTNPDESAWVIAQPAANQLQVLSAASISGWSNGDTIQVGDPLGVTPNRVIALDISPMMQTLFGRVFRQSDSWPRCSAAT